MNKVLRSCLLLAAIGVGTVTHAQPVEVRDAFFSALRNGSYKGELKGAVVESFRKQHKTPASMFINVKTIHVFKQEGCRRLEAEFTVPDFTFKDTKGATTTFSQVMQMNLCPDGYPPQEETYTQPAGSAQISLEEMAKQRDQLELQKQQQRKK